MYGKQAQGTCTFTTYLTPSASEGAVGTFSSFSAYISLAANYIVAQTSSTYFLANSTINFTA